MTRCTLNQTTEDSYTSSRAVKLLPFGLSVAGKSKASKPGIDTPSTCRSRGYAQSEQGTCSKQRGTQTGSGIIESISWCTSIAGLRKDFRTLACS
jgi:hypothetical protein